VNNHVYAKLRHISRAGSYPEFGLYLSVVQTFFYGDSVS